MAQRINELQRLKNELERVRNAPRDTIVQEDISLPKDAEEKNSGGLLGGIGYTFGKLWGGIVRSHEGWVDAAVAQAADVFGGDEFAENVMKNDWIDYGKYDEKFNPGTGWGFAGDVASGIGNMLPAIALSFVPFAGAGLSTGWFMQSASGQAVSDAVKDTGKLGHEEWAYGTASGLLEGAIEKVSGGIGGTSLAKGIGKNIGKNALGKLAVNMAGEGLEEVASDIADPLLKRATGVDEEAEMPTWGELGRTFAVGGVTGAVMGGGQTALQAAQAGGFNNLNAINEANELTERQAENNLSQAKGKKSMYTEKDITRTKESLSKRLQKMDDAARESFLDRNANIAYMFNKDGTLTEFATGEIDKAKKARANMNPEGTAEGQTLTTATDSGSYNTDAYSAGLKGYEGKIEYKPVSVDSKASATAKQVMNTLTKLTNGKANIVLTEDALVAGDGTKKANGLYKDGIIYLDANATDYQKALAVGVHEVIHSIEGTKEYETLANFVAETIRDNPELQKRYNVDAYRAVYDAILEGDYTELTKNYQAATEMFADFLGENVAYNEGTLNRLLLKNRNILVRMWEWVKGAISKLGMTKEEREMRKGFEKLEKLLSNALEAGRGGRSLEDVEKTARAAEKAHLEDELKKKNAETKAEAEETVDNKSAVGYNKSQARAALVAKYINVPQYVRNNLYGQLNQLYNGISDGIADGIALSYGNDIYIVDSGKDQGKLDFAVRKKIHIKDSTKRNRLVNEINQEVANDRRADGTILKGLGINVGNSSRSGVGRLLREDISNSQGESQNQQNRVSQEVGDRGVQVLTEEQAIKQGVIDKKGGTVRYNLFTFEEGGGKQLLEKNLKKNGFTQAEINETVKTMTDMAEYFRMLEADVEGLVDWNSAKVLYDPKTGKNVFTAMIKNGDYPLNIDLSTICKKRKALTKVLNTLVKRGYIDTVDLSAENIVKINDILKKYGYEVACPACFVETKRYRVNDWADKFLDPWNELIKNAVPNAKDLDFVNGVYSVVGAQVDTEYLNRIINEHTKVNESGKRSKDSIAKMAELILKDESVRGYLNKADMIGSIGLEKIKQHQSKLYSLVLQKGGTSTPKIIQEVQPYNGELGIQNQLAKKASEVGGVRMFSFSDFTVLQTFDFLQVVADLASKRATMQSYTKEITFALLFGQTGIKINLSMIPAIDKTVGKNNAGLDSKGNPIYSKQWGVDYDTAKSLMFKDGYNGNVGTATIGISKNHILKLLDDPVTNYIIPYHKSSINPTLAKMMDIDWYTDYTSVQNTRYSNGEKITATEAKKFNFFKELAAAKDARKMAQNYLEWCKKNNYIPKFDEFAWHPNYYKLLVDFQVYKTVDGKEVYAPQNPVQMKFPDNFKEILKSELKNQEELDAGRDVNFEKVMEETIDVLKKPTARASIDVDADLADFPSIDKWFDALTAEELRELIDNDYTVEDISEELNVDTKKMRYLIRREGLGNSYVEDSKKAVMKQTRIDEAIEDSGASNPTYARDYITAISPKDFIDLTVMQNHMDRDSFDKGVIGDHGGIMGEYDYEKALQTSRSPYLQIDKATGRVIGHNGRHRIRALEKAGIESVEIQVEFFDEDGRLMKYGAETIPKMAISSQFDTDIETTISKIIPLNESHRAEIETTYGEKAIPKAGVRYALDTELAKKTSDRVQTIVKDKGVIRQTISDIREGKKSVKETWDEILEGLKYGERARWIEVQIALTDKQAGIVKAAHNLGINVNGEIPRARAAKSAAVNMLTYKQTDFAGNVIGESLRDIFAPIQKKGEKYAQNFNEYLLHQLNIDRMSLEANGVAEGIENKPVFQKEVTAEFSKERLAELDKQHPTFKETAEKVWQYNKNLLQYRVDAGLITQAQADLMNKMYPHYVPAFYDTTNVARTGVSGGKNRVAVRTGIKSAKGSSGKADIIDVSVAISRQTESVVRAAAINKVVAKLYDKAVETKTFIDLDIAGQEKLTDPNVDYDEKIAKDNQVVFYKDGERITLDVSEYMYAGFEGLGLYKKELNNPLESVSAKSIDIFKKLATSWNPLFAISNAFKDFGDALFHTRYNVFKYMGRYVQSAFRLTSKNSEYRKLWDAYRAMGGYQAGFYKSEVGAYDKRSGFRKGIAKFTKALDAANDYIEQIPRFAEFVASVKAGNSYEKALYDAADVTTNFSRGGDLVKKLNRSWIPFLNPAVQGWSKMYRTWVDPMDRLSEKQLNDLSKSAKGRMMLSVYGQLILRTLVLGIGAGLLNDLLYRWIDEDEDYANLPLNVKENYYLIKVGDKFIKIPKSRVTALYGMVSTRIVEYNNGNEDALNAWDWFTTAWGMVSPIDAASRSIVAPVFDVIANRTWYGGEIESRTMEQMYEAKDRYDESTSSIAIAIGQALNVSPKKVHYFLDQYSGVLGDIILPMTTNKAEQDMISARFVVDPLYTNNASTEYYDMKEELTYAKSSKDLSAMMALKYLNKSDDKLSEIYQLKRDVANYEDLSADDKKLLISTLRDLGLVDISGKATLTDKEKREITDILQALLNGSLATLTENVDAFEQIVIDEGFAEEFARLIYSDMYNEFDEKKKNTAYNKAMDYYYELYMSKMLGTKLSPKYALYDAIGANETALYLTEISKIEGDKDGNGDTITGSRKKKVQKYIQGLKLTAKQKNILLYLAGYKPTETGQEVVRNYLLQKGYRAKEINDLWKD